MVNLRQTNQRIKVLEHLRSVRTHPTAEQVYFEVKKELPAITLATVYRNLNLLAENGEIIRLEINKEFHYDADKSYHQHSVCYKCGKISDIFHKEISIYAMKKIDDNGFKPERVIVIFEGRCKQCC